MQILTLDRYPFQGPFKTEAEAKTALIEVAKQILQTHSPTVVQELSNENGDTTWIPTTMNETLTVS